MYLNPIMAFSDQIVAVDAQIVYLFTWIRCKSGMYIAYIVNMITTSQQHIYFGLMGASLQRKGQTTVQNQI